MTTFDESIKSAVMKNCNELADLLRQQGNDGWMFVQEAEEGKEDDGGWAIIAARDPKSLLSITYDLFSAVEDSCAEDELGDTFDYEPWE